MTVMASIAERDLEAEAWTMGPTDRSGLAAFVVVIRSPDDPERVGRAKSLGGTTGGEKKIAKLSALKKRPAEEWRSDIVAHMADRGPRTFNAIGVELVDQTADHLFQTTAEEGLWLAVAAGELEHTLRAPILFRKPKPKETPCKPQSEPSSSP